jgi:hypothetical protein
MIVECCSYLVHHEVRMLEEAEEAILDLDAHNVSVLLKSITCKEEILHPVILDFLLDCLLLCR